MLNFRKEISLRNIRDKKLLRVTLTNAGVISLGKIIPYLNHIYVMIISSHDFSLPGSVKRRFNRYWHGMKVIGQVCFLILISV